MVNSMESDSENQIDIIETDLTKFSQDESEFLDECSLPSEDLNKNLLIINYNNLNENTFEKLKIILEDHKSAFAWSFDDLKGPCLISEHIQSVNSGKPLCSLPYRKSRSENEIIKTEIVAFFKANIIRLSTSPW